MQLHDIKRQHPQKETMLIGRGGTRGKTSGRGGKGQTARAGNKRRPEIRDIIKKLPKQRGYRFNSIETKPVVVNLAKIEAAYTAGEVVNAETLMAKKVISTAMGRTPKIKILGTGALTKKLTVKGCLVSKAAQALVEAAGGTIEA